MSAGITRDQALNLLHRYVSDPSIIKHSLASEAVLAALAVRMNEDREMWAMAGLLHDIDIEITHAEPAVHGSEAPRILAEQGVDPAVITSIRRHNRHSCNEARATALDHALAAGETITGLIVATALIYPDKKLASVQARSVTKRMKESRFAASVNRDSIRECEMLGIGIEELVDLALKSMQSISEDLGL